MRNVDPDETGALRAVFVASAATICFQLAVTKVLSFIFWNHVVYLILSLCLLGYGISSTLIAVHGERLARLPKRRVLGGGALLFSITAVVAVRLVGVIELRLPAHGASSIGDLVAAALPVLEAYGILTVPFVCAGTVIAYAFYGFEGAFGRLYAYDLVGAALGAGCFVLGIGRVGALGLVLATALLPAAFAASTLLSAGDRRSRHWGMCAAAVALGCALVWPIRERAFPLSVEPTKTLGVALDPKKNPTAKIEYSAWDVVTRLNVVSGGNRPVELGWTTMQPPDKLVTFDGDAISHMTPRSKAFPTAEDYAEFERTSYQRALVAPSTGGDALVIGLGGGPDLGFAQLLKARSITGVDVNAALIDAMKTRYATENGGMFIRANTNIAWSDGRSYLEQQRRRYDLIYLSGVDTFSALSSGAYVLAENYLYTVDALATYFQHLTPSGSVLLLRWFYPGIPRETIRLFATVLEALARSGVKDPTRHVFVAHPDGFFGGFTLIRKEPITELQIDRLLEAGANMPGAHRIAYAPGDPARWAAHGMAESRFFLGYADAFRTGTEQRFQERYPFDISPTSDDKPFFFNYYRASQIFTLNWREIVGTGPIQGYWPYLVFLGVFVGALISTVLFIWLPMRRLGRAALPFAKRASLMVYFSALGFGFIMLEIGLMQKLALVLGHPTYSIAVVLTSMLLAAGLGATVARRFESEPRRALLFALLGVLVAAGAMAIGWDTIAGDLLRRVFWVRAMAAASASMMTAFPLGFFFPIGLATARAYDRGYVPWAWAINSGTTVLGSVLTIAFAMYAGFTAVLLTALWIYAIGVAALWPLVKSSSSLVERVA